MNTIEKNIKAAQEHGESAMLIIGRNEQPDWHAVQSAIAQMTQATAAFESRTWCHRTKIRVSHDYFTPNTH